MPTRGNAFDFVDNPSESDDKLPPISRRLKKPTTTTVAAIVAMTGKPTSAVGTMNDRNQRCNSRNRNKLAQASVTESPNSNDELSDAAKKREKREKANQARDARQQKMDDRSALGQLADEFAESCTDDVLVDRLLWRTQCGEAHGPWDGNMMRLEVEGDGNCLFRSVSHQVNAVNRNKQFPGVNRNTLWVGISPCGLGLGIW